MQPSTNPGISKNTMLLVGAIAAVGGGAAFFVSSGGSATDATGNSSGKNSAAAALNAPAPSAEVRAAVGAASQEAASLLQQAVNAKDRMTRGHSFEQLGAKLAEENIEEFFHLLETTKSRGDRDSLLRGAFFKLAAGDAQKAIATLKKLGGRDMMIALNQLVTEWKSGDVMSGEMGNNDFAVRAQTAMLARDLLEGPMAKPELAVELAKALMPEDEGGGRGRGGPFGGREGLIAAAAEAMAKTDPQGALKLMEGLSEGGQNQVRRQVAEGWASTDPAGALAWALTQAEGDARNSAMQGVARTVAQENLSKAKDMLTGVTDAGARGVLVEEITRAAARTSRADGKAFIATLTNADEIKAATDRLNRERPVGTGMILDDRRGEIVIRGVMENSPAYKSGALKEGDRLVAISDGTGNMVPLAGQRTDTATAYIRGGADDAVVKVQVLRADQAGNQTTFTVDLPKEELQRGDGGGGRDFRGPGGGAPPPNFGGGFQGGRGGR